MNFLVNTIVKNGCTAYYYRQQSLGQGNVFTPVCQSFYSLGVSGQTSSLGRHPSEQTPPPRPTPPRQTTSWADPRKADDTTTPKPPPLPHQGRHHHPQAPSPCEMATEVGGTHPSEMHSC